MTGPSIPHIDMYIDNQPVKLHLSTRATATFVSLQFVQRNGIVMIPVTYKLDRFGAAHGKVLGEIECTVSRASLTLTIHALVVQHLHVDILAGLEFMEIHEISLLPRRQVSIYDNKYIFDQELQQQGYYGTSVMDSNANAYIPIPDNEFTINTIRNSNSHGHDDLDLKMCVNVT